MCTTRKAAHNTEHKASIEKFGILQIAIFTLAMKTYKIFLEARLHTCSSDVSGGRRMKGMTCSSQQVPMPLTYIRISIKIDLIREDICPPVRGIMECQAADICPGRLSLKT